MLKSLNLAANQNENTKVDSWGCSANDFCRYCDTDDYCAACDMSDWCVWSDT